ncbi:MAG: hypothetical protein ACI8QS_003130, partial [Planctomycetota bacterium]
DWPKRLGDIVAKALAFQLTVAACQEFCACSICLGNLAVA